MQLGEAYQIKNQNGLYFLTFLVVGWADVFSRKIYRDILIENMDYYRKNGGLLIWAYVIMTNHMHVVWSAENGNLSDLVRDFKKRTSKEIMNEIHSGSKESRRDWLEMIFKYHAKFNKRTVNRQFWTHENHAVELVSNEMIDQRVNYIHQNPVKAGWVFREEEYVYSSAANYANELGLIEVDKI